MRADAIANVRRQFSSGDFLQTLSRRVAYKTESQSTGREAELRAYLDMEMRPSFAELDFESRLVESPSGKSPFLVAEHREDARLPTVLIYGHGDVVPGMEGEWRGGLDPWTNIPEYADFSRMFANLRKMTDPAELGPFLGSNLVGSPETICRRIDALIGLGFNYFMVSSATPGTPRAVRQQMMTRFAEQICPRYSSAMRKGRAA